MQLLHTFFLFGWVGWIGGGCKGLKDSEMVVAGNLPLLVSPSNELCLACFYWLSNYILQYVTLNNKMMRFDHLGARQVASIQQVRQGLVPHAPFYKLIFIQLTISIHIK